MRVLVTGASGFVGGAVARRLVRDGHEVVAAIRTAEAAAAIAGTPVPVGAIGPATDWSAALAGAEAVVHCAARVHVLRETAADPDAAFHAVNAEGTARLADAARRAGVRRFVLVSTAKVLGEASPRGRPLADHDPPAPGDAYARSKLAAEQALAATGIAEPVVLRPPLVYGPGVKGNLAALARAVARGLPLPFGALRNRRSLVGLANLALAIRLAVEHPDAGGGTFLAADWSPSTADLVRALARALGVRPRLVPVPVSLLVLAGRLAGRGAAMDRLTGSLELAADGLRDRLGWRPEPAPDAELARLARALAAVPGPAPRCPNPCRPAAC